MKQIFTLNLWIKTLSNMYEANPQVKHVQQHVKYNFEGKTWSNIYEADL